MATRPPAPHTHTASSPRWQRSAVRHGPQRVGVLFRLGVRPDSSSRVVMPLLLATVVYCDAVLLWSNASYVRGG